jgi:xylulokinase
VGQVSHPNGCLLGIDLGTSGVRALVMDVGGEIRAIAHRTYPLQMPVAGWAEQDPHAWWEATSDAVREAVAAGGVRPGDVTAIGLSGQMHGLIPVDQAGQPLRPAIVWLDRRSEDEALYFSATVGLDELYRTTGMPCAPGIFGPSLLWLKRHERSLYGDIHAALLPKDYIRFRLTGDFASDPTDASGSLLFDVLERTWSEEVVLQVGLDMAILPGLREPTEIAGRLGDTVAAELGLAGGIPVSTGGSDQAMSAVGCGLVDPGLARCAIGSGGQMITTTREPLFEAGSGLHVLCNIEPGSWLLMGATTSAGLSLRWFKSAFGSEGAPHGSDDAAYDALSAEAEQVPPGCDGLIFLPYLAGERTPHMDPHAKGCFIGVDISHGRQHFVRSIMEGVAYSMKDCLQVFEKLGLQVVGVIASGGGAKSPVWRSIQADVYGVDVLVSGHDEHSALGAAMVAGISCGVFTDVRDACRRVGGPPIVVHPNAENVPTYQERHRVFQALYPALRDVAW